MRHRIKSLPFALGTACLLSLLLLISPWSLFSQDSSPPSPDFNGNGVVDISDFLLFVDAFGSKEGQELYDAKYDLDGNEEIGVGDFLIFIDSFGKEVNRVPVFTSEPPVMRFVAENTPSGQPIGDPISATDADGDILTYRLSGDDSDNFAIDASTGQITTQGTYNFEEKSSYSVTVIVSDGEGGSASLVVNITINDIEEPTAAVPSNVVVEEGDSKLTVRWDAVPDEAGKPPVTGYEVGHRERPDPFDPPRENSNEWAGIQKVSSQLNSLIITGLLNGQAYEVSVRTLVDGGMSEWSSPVLGIPVIPASGPIFIGGGGGGGGGTSPPPSPPRPQPPPPQQPPQPRTPEITISAGTSPVTEGTSATFTITANPAPATALTVNVDVSETGDVISGTPSSTVTIDANKTSATLTVNTVNDEGDEPNSVVTAQVETGTGYTVGSSSSASVTVNDNDISPPGTPEVTISAGTTPVTEGTSATFTITVSPAQLTALTVSVKVTEDGDVISGTSSSSVIINANNTTATLTVATDNDDADESNSVVTARLQGGTGYTVGSSSSASVTVNDNDIPEITILAGTTPVAEGTSATFTITASSASTSALTVNVNVSETGDVISGTPSSSVIINANNTTATLTVATDDDDADESNSVVTARLQGGTGYTVGSSSSASVTVNDNDNPAPPPPPPGPITPSITPVCDRTPQVRDEIVRRAPVSTCSDVTDAHLAAITKLAFFKKGISALQAGDFSGLTALTWIGLEYNELSSLSAGIFSGLTALETLDLHHNALSSLDADTFSGLTALEDLRLDSNKLSSLDADIFSGLTALEDLRLDNNRLSSSLDAGIFAGLPALKILHLHDNQFSSLGAGIFAGLTRAPYWLWLQRNPVDPLPITISLEKVGEGRFKAKAHTGATFEYVLPIVVENGSIDGGSSSITIPVGSVESAEVSVSRTAGTTAAVTVNIGTLPPEPLTIYIPEWDEITVFLHSGYTLEKSADLPLEVIASQ